MQEFQGFWRGEGFSFELFSCPQVLAVGRETSENVCLSDEHPVKESSLRLSSGRIELGLVVARRFFFSRVDGLVGSPRCWRLHILIRFVERFFYKDFFCVFSARLRNAIELYVLAS